MTPWSSAFSFFGCLSFPQSAYSQKVYGELQQNTPALTLPHPRAHEREFVLRPLCDIDPQLVLPGHTLSVSDMLAALPAGPAVHAFDL